LITDETHTICAGPGGATAAWGLEPDLLTIDATLREVLTPAAFVHMESLAVRWADGVADVTESAGLAWHVNRLGCRAEYWFCPPPSSGGDAAAAVHHELENLIHLACLNRGILLTPFHNMALMSPVTTAVMVDRHSEVFAEVVALLIN